MEALFSGVSVVYVFNTVRDFVSCICGLTVSG